MELPIVATPPALLLQVPPASGSVNVTELLVHTVLDPAIAPGVWFTVTVVVAGVPQPFEYVIVTVPAATPVIMPDVLPAVAMERSLLLQLPTPPGLLNVVVAPVQTLVVPVMPAGAPLTTNVETVLQPVTV